MSPILTNLRVTRPALITIVALWLSGFFVLLIYNGNVSNPVETGRALLGHLGTTDSVSSTDTVKVKQHPYDGLCASVPHHADDLRQLDERWGKTALEMSIAHAGSGIRMRRALRRLVNGEVFTIAVIGGSITAGHGVNRTNGDPYPEGLGKLLRNTYPNVKVINGGLAGHGTDYFANCYQLLLPANADLYILEAAINDLENEGHVANLKENWSISRDTEVLVRQLLSNRPDNAVMMLSSFAPQTPYVNAAHWHGVVSEYYDLPRLSMRTFMYPYMLQFPDERVDRFASPDIRHPNEIGHKYLAEVLLRYLLREACRAAEEQEENVIPHSIDEFKPALEAQVKDEPASYDPARVKDADKPWLPYPGVGGSELKYTWDPFTLPSLRINQQWMRDKHVHPEGHSFCQTVDKLAPDGLPVMRPSAMTGDWGHHTANGKHYWKGTKPGSVITFSDIEVSAGIITLYHLRCDKNYGNVKCWIDGDKGRAVEIASKWNFVCVASLHVIAENISPGKHSLSCEVLEKTSDDKNHAHDFAISAIVSH